jgi:hypothetical protein
LPNPASAPAVSRYARREFTESEIVELKSFGTE